jgi:hypothetical protein
MSSLPLYYRAFRLPDSIPLGDYVGAAEIPRLIHVPYPPSRGSSWASRRGNAGATLSAK